MHKQFLPFAVIVLRNLLVSALAQYDPSQVSTSISQLVLPVSYVSHSADEPIAVRKYNRNNQKKSYHLLLYCIDSKKLCTVAIKKPANRPDLIFIVIYNISATIFYTLNYTGLHCLLADINIPQTSCCVSTDDRCLHDVLPFRVPEPPSLSLVLHIW